MENFEVRFREGYSNIIKFDQMYGIINEDSDVHVNGSISIVGKDNIAYKKARVHVNLCNKDGLILYVLNTYNNFHLKENEYFSFSVFCSTLNRYFDIKELAYAEVYVIFNEK